MPRWCADETVVEAKVAPLAGNKVLVAYIVQDGWKNTLETQVATCGVSSD